MGVYCKGCEKEIWEDDDRLCPQCASLPPVRVDYFVGQPTQHMTKDQLRQTVRTLREGLRRIISMAGNPDAAMACRVIIAECESLLPNKVISNSSE